MKLGYCRVSTDDQNPDLQLAALKRAGCKQIFTDKATGAHIKRPELGKCLKSLKAGDTLIVWKLDRLGLTGANAGKFTVAILAKNYTFRSWYFSLRQTRKIKGL